MNDEGSVSVPNLQLLAEAKEQLLRGNVVTLHAKGRSMEPFIIDGDIVELKSQQTYHPGDVVLACVHSGKYVLHRVISITGRQVQLMGDGNKLSSEMSEMDQLFGKVIAVYKTDGRKIDYNSHAQMLKGRVWVKLKPARRLLLGTWRRLR